MEDVINGNKTGRLTRREFLRRLAAGAAAPGLSRLPGLRASAVLNDVFWVQGIPDQPFYDPGQPNYHVGLDSLLCLMADSGLNFYRSASGHPFASPSGLIAPADIVLIKVNAQWKYRGCTNSDLIRGLIQRILDHPDGFSGEVVIIENGQGRGSLRCDTTASYGGEPGVHANANDESHHFLYLVDRVFRDPRVSAFLLDPVRRTFLGNHDHTLDGYRRYENVSYPCFTTAGGNRVELREGIWKGGAHSRNLKLINVPVLKHHDFGGSEITASLKHMYGLVSMFDGQRGFRHYGGLGETCGKLMASVVPPVLNIIDAIWVSHSSLSGFPPQKTFRANQLLASQDPVAADYWAAKYILYPVDGDFRHHPDFPGIDRWLVQARDTINGRGGLFDPEKGILVGRVTRDESEMRARTTRAGNFLNAVRLSVSRSGLHFRGPIAEGGTLEKALEISVSGAAPLAWTTETDVPWLSCRPASASGNMTVAVVVYPAGLAPGRHTGRLTIRCPGASNSPQPVSVVLSLQARTRSSDSRSDL
jgi:uncharacterized protein (DUF362 family)